MAILTQSCARLCTSFTVCSPNDHGADVALALRIRRTLVAVAEQRHGNCSDRCHGPSPAASTVVQEAFWRRTATGCHRPLAAGTEPAFACWLDEPTGNLDLENGNCVFDLLLQATREQHPRWCW